MTNQNKLVLKLNQSGADEPKCCMTYMTNMSDCSLSCTDTPRCTPVYISPILTGSPFAIIPWTSGSLSKHAPCNNPPTTPPKPSIQLWNYRSQPLYSAETLLICHRPPGSWPTFPRGQCSFEPGRTLQSSEAWPGGRWPWCSRQRDTSCDPPGLRAPSERPVPALSPMSQPRASPRRLTSLERRPAGRSSRGFSTPPHRCRYL